jgi:hypothetical protein
MPNEKFTDDIELRALHSTDDMTRIETAVYGDNRLAIEHVVYNPLLLERHCRYIYQKMEPMSAWPTIILLAHPSFPHDLLMELALDPSNSTRTWIQSGLLNNPNATDEILAVMSLMDSPIRRDI